MNRADMCGLAVYSLCGRDRKRLCLVVGTLDEDFVLIADGRLHTLEHPKKKRLKHVHFTGARITAFPDNTTLYNALSALESHANRRDCSAEG